MYVDHYALALPDTNIVQQYYKTKDLQKARDKSDAVEAVMHEVARRNDTVRFIKFHDDEYEKKHHELYPVVVGYKAGKYKDTITNVDAKLAKDSELSAVSLETLFRQ